MTYSEFKMVQMLIRRGASALIEGPSGRASDVALKGNFPKVAEFLTRVETVHAAEAEKHQSKQPEAAPAMQAIRERLAGSPDPAQDLRLVELSSAGLLRWVDERGKPAEAEVEWFAATPDRKHAAMLAGTTLAVVIDRAAIGIDAGSLLGTSMGGWQLTMLVAGDEVTVFALPELGGAVMPDEPGYVLEFNVAPQASKPWQISVGRVSVSP